ncbi:MAG: RHS repeat-associated core domain-containing protein, partial [Candidatus Polarisedimenticolia bacterium]
GSPRLITDTAGNLVAKQKYLPFGEEIQLSGSTKNTHKFTGHERDAETGLDYMIGRYYSRSHARFSGADPVLGSNLYTYVSNNPLVLVDPYGMEEFNAMADGLASMAAQGHCGHCGISNPGLGAAMNGEYDANGEFQITGTPGVPFDYDADDPIFGPFGMFKYITPPKQEEYNAFKSFASQVEGFIRGNKPDLSLAHEAYVTRTTSSIENGVETVTVTSQKVWVFPSGPEIVSAELSGPLGRVTGFSAHALNRIIQRGVAPNRILDALKNPIRLGPVTLRDGRPSQVIYGRYANVVQNPETGRIITTWSTTGRIP